MSRVRERVGVCMYVCLCVYVGVSEWSRVKSKLKVGGVSMYMYVGIYQQQECNHNF